MKATVFQTHKRSAEKFQFIQDKYCIEENSKVFAIADGTTQSFQSNVWADLLVTEFCRNPKFEAVEFIELACNAAGVVWNERQSFSAHSAFASLEEEKFKGGSTSTFLGVKIDSNSLCRVMGVGDCNLFIIKKSGRLDSYPFQSFEEISANQSFLNTIELISGKYELSNCFSSSFRLEDGDELVLCSDAFAKMILKDSGLLHEFLHLHRWNNFISKIEKCWSNNLLEEDDITMIRISEFNIEILNSNDVNFILPPEGFIFPPPSPPWPSPEPFLKISEMDLKTIMYNFSCIQKDFQEIKCKQNKLERLFIVMIGLIGVVIILFVLVNLREIESSIIGPAKLDKKDEQFELPKEERRTEANESKQKKNPVKTVNETKTPSQKKSEGSNLKGGLKENTSEKKMKTQNEGKSSNSSSEKGSLEGKKNDN